MKRLRRVFWLAPAALLVAVPDALAMHNPSHRDIASNGFPWGTVSLWVGIGVAIVVLAALVVEGQRHHWHVPHRTAHA